MSVAADQSRIAARIAAPGPKRILALDGGGVRGIVTLAFLARIEAELRRRSAAPERFRLSDYFDLVGGTSAGAIIAVGLALGYRVGEVRDLYREVVPRVFRRSWLRVAGWRAKFDGDRLLVELRRHLGDRTLDSADLLTGLAVVTKRADTGSPWVLTNNPASMFWQTPGDGSFVGNRHFNLAQLVRASTAAPFYFAPEAIEIVRDMPPGLFIDGALSPHNNPALQLLMLARMRQYGFGWSLGADRLLMISIGTGTFRYRVDAEKASKMMAATFAVNALRSLVQDSERLVLQLMQWLSEPDLAWPINAEIGDLRGETLTGEKLLAFQRYDLPLESGWLAEQLGRAVSPRQLERLHRLDDPGIINDIEALANAAADRLVAVRHFPPAFDPQPAP